MYRVASGDVIQNEGEKTFAVVTEDGTCRGVRAQVCDVDRDLLSVSKMVKTGNMVLFHPLGSFIQDLETEERVWLKDHDGTYSLSLWVKNQAF